MQLDHPFILLRLRFDAARLAEEVSAFAESDWRPHPEGHPGNSALPLVAVGGDPNSDSVKGVMQATPHLHRAPYLRQVLAALRAPIGRTRLMRLDGESEATPHVDTNYYWFQRMRVHVPIVTDPAVRFLCGDEERHMAPGETWIFDTWRRHNVINPNPTRRIHLVADTVGSPEFRALLAGGETRFLPFRPDAQLQPRFEVHNFPAVMTPEEQASLMAQLHLPHELRALLDEFRAAWRAVYAEVGLLEFGRYRALLDQVDAKLAPFAGRFQLANHMDAVEAVRQILIRSALNPELAPREEHGRGFRFDRPIFIVSSPRSGSTLLFETLAQSPSVYTIGGESHQVIEGIPQLHPSRRGWDSNRLLAADANIVSADELYSRFAESLHDRDGNDELSGAIRMLEKTPKNSLRIPFLKAMFPNAFFIYLYRDPRATMSSMLDAWRSGRFATYPDLPGWEGHKWSLLLVPGWRELIGKPLAEVVAHQWTTATSLMLDDLEALPSDSWCVASYDRLIEDPQKEIARLCEFVGIEFDRKLTAPLPNARHTLTPPSPEKWRRNANELESVAALTNDVAERAREVFARPPAQRVRRNPAPAAAQRPAVPFKSVHTSTFPSLLEELRVSVLVSTYQSGRLVVLRSDNGSLNTHFRGFRSPMGVAVAPNRVALATMGAVWDYRNQPALSQRIQPAGRHDAVFIPRNMHATGDIRVHEIAFDSEGELWITNTRFSALCTLDRDHSFVPRWRPPFITHLAAEDRCHLNGLCMLDGRPRFVTAFGETNEAQGWREGKTTNGIVMDVDSGEIVARGLSMPHSPRWYAGRFFVLESAKGTLATIDLPSGRVETIAELPGFTRGLAFAGPYAFVGLSQVRESVFEGIPLAQRLTMEERACGVWAIDLRTGRNAGFVRFDGAVQELFDVQLLHGITYPELLEFDAPLLDSSFTLPDAALAEVAR
ncbi:MAG: TIGR03032 family protein [Acidobacteria bacterium]|nr:TIGR03032 family protein [Acidobacteriota bacterium]